MALLPHRIRAVVSLSATVYTLLLLARSSTIRTALLHVFSPRSHPYRLAALLLALLLNAKTLPLAWHVRIFGTMFHQLYIQPAPLPARALFRPIVTKGCFTSLLECDYNAHKSNSTYFADLDVARSALICALLRNGIRQRGTKFPRSGATSGTGEKPMEARAGSIVDVSTKKGVVESATDAINATTTTTLRPPPSSQATSPSHSPSHSPSPSPQPQPQDPGLPESDTPTLDAIAKSKAPYTIALGAVSTHFKREIAPYEPFEIWTRVLAWDRKWMYLVSHVVRAGAVRSEDISHWAMQPWKDGSGSGRSFFLGRLFGGAAPSRRHKARDGDRKGAVSGMPKEAESAETGERAKRSQWQKAIFASSISKYVVKKGRITVPMDEVLVQNGLVPRKPHASSSSSTCADADAEDDDPTWTWENVEAERQRGLRLAEKFGALDALAEEFPVLASSSAVCSVEDDEGVVLLGEYPDLVW